MKHIEVYSTENCPCAYVPRHYLSPLVVSMNSRSLTRPEN